MTRYHVTVDGKIAICRAIKRPCARQQVPEAFVREVQQHAAGARVRPHVAPVALDERPGVANSLHAAYDRLLTDEERRVLRGYAAFDANEMNLYHYKPEFRQMFDEDEPMAYPNYWEGLAEIQDDPEKRRVYREALYRRIRVLDAAIAKGRFDTPQTVYRGLSPNGVKMFPQEDYTPASRITAVGYWSTSTNPAVALTFASVDSQRTSTIYKIRTSVGAPMGELARYMVEDEILLPRQKQYVVEGTTLQRAHRYDTKLVFNEKTLAMVNEGLQAPLTLYRREEMGEVLVVHLTEV